jgi:hypothetical protein
MPRLARITIYLYFQLRWQVEMEYHEFFVQAGLELWFLLISVSQIARISRMKHCSQYILVFWEYILQMVVVIYNNSNVCIPFSPHPPQHLTVIFDIVLLLSKNENSQRLNTQEHIVFPFLAFCYLFIHFFFHLFAYFFDLSVYLCIIITPLTYCAGENFWSTLNKSSMYSPLPFSKIDEAIKLAANVLVNTLHHH